MSSEWDEGTTRGAELSDLHQLRLASAAVEIVGGPDAGAKTMLGPTAIILGGAADCDLRLADPLVSRRHLELRAVENGVRVRDLGSRNGTFMGTVQLQDAVLRQDTALTVGSTQLQLRIALDGLSLALSPQTQFGRAIGHSPAMRHVFALLEQAAKRDVTVLLEGDSGTGKDVLAVSLHEASTRSKGPFVVVDCGAIPDTLIESELFGHERGAFTGATALREGAFELAQGGTVFLDEIGELPIEMQPKLLRVLENRSFRRVGGREPIEVDVRVVAATNRGLAEAVRRNEFREDLFYRIAVLRVHVPPLGERPEDIVPLALRFYRALAGSGAALPAELSQLLASYSWPGNARELRNVIERFATIGSADRALLFNEPAQRSSGATLAFDIEHLLGVPYHDAKREMIDAFHHTVLPLVVERAGSIAAAADHLGIPRPSLHRMLKR